MADFSHNNHAKNDRKRIQIAEIRHCYGKSGSLNPLEILAGNWEIAVSAHAQ